MTITGATAADASATLPGNSGSALYLTGVGIGGAANSLGYMNHQPGYPGGSGLVTISYSKTVSLITYNCTNDMRTFTAPARVTSVGVTVTGASGASNGGYGGVVRTTLKVTPGATYYVVVGCQGVGSDGGYNVRHYCVDATFVLCYSSF